MKPVTKNILIVNRLNPSVTGTKIDFEPIDVCGGLDSEDLSLEEGMNALMIHATLEFDFTTMTAKIVPTDKYFIDYLPGKGTKESPPPSTKVSVEPEPVEVCIEPPVTKMEDRTEPPHRKALGRPPKKRKLHKDAQVFSVDEKVEKKVIVTGVPGTAQPPLPPRPNNWLPASKRKTPGTFSIMNYVDDVIMSFTSRSAALHFAKNSWEAKRVVDPDNVTIWTNIDAKKPE